MIGKLVRNTAIIIVIFAALSLMAARAISPLYTISTEIELPATPERSWKALTNFAEYPDWNPYLRRVEGQLAPGETVSFTLVDGNFADPLELTAQVVAVEPNKEFYWIGTLGIPGIHDTRHVFQLVPQADGTTLLRHFEEFGGLLPALLPNREQRTAHTREAFDSMNKALQVRLAAD